MVYPYRRRAEPTGHPEWPEAYAVPAWHHPESRAYLQERGVTQEEAVWYDLAYCDAGFWARRVLIPMYSSGGELLAFQGRTINNDEPRYRTSGPRPLYRPYHLRAFGGRLCVVEGPFDVFALMRAEIPAVATLGILLSPSQIEALRSLVCSEHVRDVWVWFDQGAEDEAFLLQMRLRPFVASCRLVSSSAKDPGECSVGTVRALLTPAHSGVPE